MVRQRKALTFITGQFESMTPVEIIKVEGRSDKSRSVATISTEDGQTLFLEMRDATISKIKKLGVQMGDAVTIGMVFIGIEKKGRFYNNLFLNEITYAKAD